MPRPSRTRRTLKWIGAWLVLTILIAWVASLWGAVFLVFPSDRAYVGAGQGTLGYVTSNFDMKAISMITGFRYQGRHGWGFILPRRVSQTIAHQSFDAIEIPLWLPFLLTAIPTAWLWHRDRGRIRPGCCLRCGYDLTGNTSGVCPECGDKVYPPAVLADSVCGAVVGVAPGDSSEADVQ